MTFSSNSGYCMISYRMSVQMFFRLSFCSWARFFRTNFAQTFHILSSLSKICRTVSLLIPTMPEIILKLRHQSLRTFSLIFWMFWSVFKVEGQPECSSSSTSSRPSLNLLCHSNTRERDIKLSPYIFFNNLMQSVGDFFNFIRNFRLTRRSIFSLGKLTVQCSLQTGVNNKLNWIARQKYPHSIPETPRLNRFH